MNKKLIKQIFKENGVQLGKGTIEVIEDELQRSAGRMAKRCFKGNINRLTPELMYIALGRYSSE